MNSIYILCISLIIILVIIIIFKFINNKHDKNQSNQLNIMQIMQGNNLNKKINKFILINMQDPSDIKLPYQFLSVERGSKMREEGLYFDRSIKDYFIIKINDLKNYGQFRYQYVNVNKFISSNQIEKANTNENWEFLFNNRITNGSYDILSDGKYEIMSYGYGKYEIMSYEHGISVIDLYQKNQDYIEAALTSFASNKNLSYNDLDEYFNQKLQHSQLLLKEKEINEVVSKYYDSVEYIKKINKIDTDKKIQDLIKQEKISKNIKYIDELKSIINE